MISGMHKLHGRRYVQVGKSPQKMVMLVLSGIQAVEGVIASQGG